VLSAKVAALITRRIGDRVEICVFDHAGSTQLPAGTLEPDEDPIAGAVREAWEETGLPHLELSGEVAVLSEFELDERPNVGLMVAPHEGCPVTRGHAVLVHDRHGEVLTISNEHFGWRGEVAASCVERDVARHVVHLRTTRPTPDEWWVLTPDGDGSQWRCRWVPIDEVDVHPWQQRWIDAASGHLDAGPAVERAPAHAPGATEVFDAYNEVRLVVRRLRSNETSDAPRGSSYGLCVTADGDAVLVNEDGRPAWGLPGGRPEAGETPDETLAREVVEEACARVLDAELLFATEDTFLDTERAVTHRFATSIYWARVALEPWEPRFEKTARHLVPLADIAEELRWELPLFLEIHAGAMDAEARRR
jgi:8-oxo-dGTP pyrophosphatase MutT (NUDIX family)